METIVVRPEHAEQEESEESKTIHCENGSEDNTASPSEPEAEKRENTDDNASETEEDERTILNEDQDVLDDDLGMGDLPVNASMHAADEMKRRLEEIDPCEKLRALCK